MTLLAGEHVAITGTGHSLPPTVRSNDDPIFDYLNANHPSGIDLFKGYKYRRVIAPGESLEDLMAKASFLALENARVKPGDIDVITGYVSVSDFIEPNGLAAIHHQMGLPAHCIVLPINDEYTNSLSGLMIADALIKAGKARNALVVVGCNWTQYSNYTKPQAISSSDGAGAMVVGATTNKSRFALVDYEISVQQEGYGGMRMAPYPAGPFYTKPWCDIDDDGVMMFKNFAMTTPPAVVNTLLKRNGITGADITLVPYQASTVLLDPWQQAIKPAQTIVSIEELANMTLATISVNFARQYDSISKDWVCMIGVGTQFQAIGVLLRRNP